jgi:hypothetical protein
MRRFFRCWWRTGGVHELEIASGRCRYCWRELSASPALKRNTESRFMGRGDAAVEGAVTGRRKTR